MRKVTLLRKNENSPDGVEVVAAEGFSVRSLLDMQENYMKFARVAGEAMMLAEYKEMNRELEDIENKILDLVLDNRFGNGTMNPDFALWTQEDKDAVDVPLWDMKRNWHWLDEGAEWVEEFQEAKEVQVMNDDDVFREHLYVHRHTNGNRVIGLIGPEQKPAVFMGGANKPNVIYRLAVEPEELNEEELADYQTVLASTKELEEIRTMSSETSEED